MLPINMFAPPPLRDQTIGHGNASIVPRTSGPTVLYTEYTGVLCMQGTYYIHLYRVFITTDYNYIIYN